VPIGVSGEIYIGGVGLARGYLNRPDLTAEKFVPNPFLTEENLQEGKSLRLYRTGDLARFLLDGNIAFLGRIDDQVKIRGFRIELGEIESMLSQHGDVTQTVVMAREDEPGDKKLVAYVVPPESIASSLDQESILTSSAQQDFAVLRGEALPSVTETLRNHLIKTLPDYMIPAFFVFLDKIPLTSNGKMDRKSLPAPDLSLRQVADAYVAPTTQIEEELCAIWSEVLRIEKIGIHDNFFRIGGHSLLATQVISRINSSTNIKLSLIDLFEKPTIKMIADAQEREFDSSLKSPLIMISAGDSQKIPLFMIHPGGGMAYCYQPLSKYIKSTPIYGINNPSCRDGINHFKTIEAMATSYIAIIKKEYSGPFFLAGWSFGGNVAYEIVQQLQSEGSIVKGLILIDSVNPRALKFNPSLKEEKRSKKAEKEDSSIFLDQYTKGLFDLNMRTSGELMDAWNPTKFRNSTPVFLLKAAIDAIPMDEHYGWRELIPNLTVQSTAGSHFRLFNYSFIKSTAANILSIMATDSHKITAKIYGKD